MRTRKEILWFAEEHMERRLEDNDDKRHWKSVAPVYLIDRLGRSYEKLCTLVDLLRRVDSVEGSPEPSALTLEILDKTGDVANYAMMIADNTRSALLNTMQSFVEHCDEGVEEEEGVFDDARR